MRCGYEVLARFEEPGQSAKTANRTELQKLLNYCRKNKGRVQFVIVFSLSQFAREKFDHVALRAHLKSLGISLRSATEPIDDTATGKLMEDVLAAFALGRWIFSPSLGYLPGGHRSRPSLVHDPARAPLVRRAFEEVATGQSTKKDVLALVTRLGLRTRGDLVLTPQSFGDMLSKPVYAGFIESPKFDVARRGDFERATSRSRRVGRAATADGTRTTIVGNSAVP